MASNKNALGICDRTGFTYPLKDLVTQYVDGKPTGIKVGKDVVDIDNEQLQLGRLNVSDDQPLTDPRPNQNLPDQRALTAWAPVGGGITEMGSATLGLVMNSGVGRVTVT